MSDVYNGTVTPDPAQNPDGQEGTDTGQGMNKPEEPKEKAPKKKKKVKVNLPKLRGEKDQTVWVCVNGKGILIQRGKDVEIDPEYAEVLKHSQQADEIADEFLAGLEDGGED